MNSDIALDNVNYWHFGVEFSIQKHAGDLFAKDKLVAFQPLLSSLTPNFKKNVVSNENFLDSLNSKEIATLQRLIDQILYRTVSMNNLSLDEYLCILFILNQANGDLIELKLLAIQSVTSKIGFDNVLDVLEILEKYQHREEIFFSSTTDKQTGQLSPLDKVKDYCLDFMGSQASEPGYEYFIEPDERVDRYLRFIIKRKILKPVHWNEQPNNISKRPVMDLFNNASTSDLTLQVGNEKVHCHKTILISKSVYFSTLFKGNWAIEMEEYGPEMKYLIQYCYGFLNSVPSSLQIPLIKRAHEHEMTDLIPIVTRRIVVGKDNVESLWKELEHYSDEKLFSELIGRVVKYGDP